MKRNLKRSYAWLAYCGILLFLLSSCGSPRYARAKYGGTSTAQYHKSTRFLDSGTDGYDGDALASLGQLNVEAEEAPLPEQHRKIIYDADMDLTVKKPDSINEQLTMIADKYDGYSLNMGSSRSVIRVKAAYLYHAMDDIGKLGKVTDKDVYGDDVTEQYFDSQIRLDNAKKARERYLELLAKAENVEAALLVEKELERLNGEIDRLQGQLKRMEHLTEYSTITVRIYEKVKPGPLGYLGMGLYYSVKWLFVRN